MQGLYNISNRATPNGFNHGDKKRFHHKCLLLQLRLMMMGNI